MCHVWCVCISAGFRIVAILVMVRCVYTHGTECMAGVQDPHSKGVTGRYPECSRA